MLAISLRHVLLFIANVLGVTDVTEGVQAALQSASGTSFSQTCQTSKEQKLLNIQEHKLIFVVYGLLRDKPDLGPFPVDVPQTLVLAESRLFLIGPELWAGFGMSCFSSKEETTHSLLSSRSVYCRHTREDINLLIDDGLPTTRYSFIQPFMFMSPNSKFKQVNNQKSHCQFLDFIFPLRQDTNAPYWFLAQSFSKLLLHFFCQVIDLVL